MPRRMAPAAMELEGLRVSGCDGGVEGEFWLVRLGDWDDGGVSRVLEGEGVSGVEKGCAADVDVAGDGFSGFRRDGVMCRFRRKGDGPMRRW